MPSYRIVMRINILLDFGWGICFTCKSTILHPFCFKAAKTLAP